MPQNIHWTQKVKNVQTAYNLTYKDAIEKWKQLGKPDTVEKTKKEKEKPKTKPKEKKEEKNKIFENAIRNIIKKNDESSDVTILQNVLKYISDNRKEIKEYFQVYDNPEEVKDFSITEKTKFYKTYISFSEDPDAYDGVRSFIVWTSFENGGVLRDLFVFPSGSKKVFSVEGRKPKTYRNIDINNYGKQFAVEPKKEKEKPKKEKPKKEKEKEKEKPIHEDDIEFFFEQMREIETSQDLQSLIVEFVVKHNAYYRKNNLKITDLKTKYFRKISASTRMSEGNEKEGLRIFISSTQGLNDRRRNIYLLDNDNKLYKMAYDDKFRLLKKDLEPIKPKEKQKIEYFKFEDELIKYIVKKKDEDEWFYFGDFGYNNTFYESVKKVYNTARINKKEIELFNKFVNNQYGFDFFPTPANVIKIILKDILDNKNFVNTTHLLEPSAGVGSIVKGFISVFGHDSKTITANEMLDSAKDILDKELDGVKIIKNDFLDMPVGDVYDTVIMNPPFSSKMRIKGHSSNDKIYYNHIVRGLFMLKQWGTLYCICPQLHDKNHEENDFVTSFEDKIPSTVWEKMYKSLGSKYIEKEKIKGEKNYQYSLHLSYQVLNIGKTTDEFVKLEHGNAKKLGMTLWIYKFTVY